MEIAAEGFTFDIPAPTNGRLVEQKLFARDAVKPGDLLGYVLADNET